MFYDRKIKYLDVYERGEKVQNAGFVRWEARDSKVSVQVKVEKLRQTDTCTAQILLAGNGKETVWQDIQLERGCGVLECQGLDRGDLAGGISYEEM